MQEVYYFTGNGEPATMGIKTIQAIKNHSDQLRRQNRITSGKATSFWHGNYGVNLEAPNYHIERTDSFPFCKIESDKTMFHVGDTKVEYKTICNENTKKYVTTFTAFEGDGFWDPIDLSNIPFIDDDRSGPAGEFYSGEPFIYEPYSWDVSFDAPQKGV